MSIVCEDWLKKTKRYDQSWLVLLGARRYMVFGSVLVVIWSARNPRQFGRLIKRGIGLWSTWRVIRKYLTH